MAFNVDKRDAQMSWQVPVFSSNVSEVGYDEGDLIIVWHSGKVSAYSGVPEEVAYELSKTASVGQMLNSEIKPNYKHRYIK